MTRFWTRLVVVLTVITGVNYIAWRWAAGAVAIAWPVPSPATA